MRQSFSRFFPAHYPRKGEPTNFVEKISVGWGVPALGDTFFEPLDYHAMNPGKPFNLINDFEKQIRNYWDTRNPAFKIKKHTIRKGHKCEVGQVYIPFAWSGIPYRSPTVIFHHPYEIKRVIPIHIDRSGSFFMHGARMTATKIDALAMNDGLTTPDFLSWLITPQVMKDGFFGQVRIWNDTDLIY